MTVPFSDAVAINVPVELKLIAASGESWAGIIVLACYYQEKDIAWLHMWNEREISVTKL